METNRRGRFSAIHGMHGSPEYKSWEGMKYRCNAPTCGAYERYGGRGIKVCQRWDDSFEAFYADMGPKPSPQHSIDRINNDGDYEPSNCRWASRRKQNNNTVLTIYLTYKGETKPITEWARITGFKVTTLRTRKRLGWPDRKIIETPLMANRFSYRDTKWRPNLNW